MALKPSSVTDALHKVSSVLAVLAGLSLTIPALSPWSSLLIGLASALGGVGVAGNVAGK